MNRRELIRTAGIVAATAGLSGCTVGEQGDGQDGAADETATDATDVSVTVVREAPDNAGPFEESVAPVTAQESDALALDGLIFQRAGQKGLVVSGDATNTGDQPFGRIVVDVTLYDQNDAGDRVLDSTRQGSDHGRLDAGGTWQWAVTFDEEPAFEIDFYTVEVSASFE